MSGLQVLAAVGGTLGLLTLAYLGLRAIAADAGWSEALSAAAFSVVTTALVVASVAGIVWGLDGFA